MKDVLTFAGKSFSDFNVFFDGSKSFGTPEKDYEIVSILGRNGDLSIYNGRFKDITISVPCFIRENFIENYRNLMQFLNSVEGYQRFETTKEPNHFRKALFVGGIEPSTGSFNKSGKFTLNFRCHPQRFLKIGENWIEFTGNGSINNPTFQTAKPLIRFTGVGNITLGIRNFTISHLSQSDVTYIDCDMYDVYAEDGTNRNSYFTGSFPSLAPGNNIIVTTFGYNDSKIEIMPRWFEI